MASSRNGSPEQALSILLIENDPAAALLTREALKEAGLHHGVTSMRDGDEALAYLAKFSRAGDEDRPDVIFLDLHLPKMSGFDVLRSIKNSATWQLTPVIVVSGSADPSEIREAYELHASCFVRKPSDLGEFLRFIRCCYEFWGSVVTLPGRNNERFSAR